MNCFLKKVIFHPDMLQINGPGECMHYVGKDIIFDEGS